MKQFFCHKCRWIGSADSAKDARDLHDADRPSCDGTPVKLDNSN